MTRAEWLRIGALIVVCVLVIVFWAVYEQQGNTMQLWADRNTNWTFAGVTIPSTWYQAFNPAMIFLFSPLLSAIWARQSKKGREMSTVMKMATGCFLLGISFLVMIVAAQGATDETRRSVLWLVGTTVILTVGELYLSPVGLSFVTKVAPARMVSMLMGVWFLANFFGNYLSGWLGTFYEKMSRDQFFLLLAVLGVSAGAVIALVSRPLHKVLRDV